MDFIAYPEWTEYRKKNGLDPLGMQTSSISFYQDLLPGISNVTLRVRYYGLYCWIVNQYSTHIGDTNPLTWQRILRRAEALYALTAAKSASEGGVAGITWASKRLEDNDGKLIDFSDDSEPGSDTHYLKQAWGAFGAAYGSQLFEIGLLASSKDHDIPVLQEDTGDKLAEIFAITNGEVGTRFFNAVQQGKVALSDLNDFVVLLPSHIDLLGAERQLYEKVLFAKVDNPTVNDINRKLTLGLILKAAEKLEKKPSVQDIRWLAYSRHLPNGDNFSIDSSELDTQTLHWWTYQANDLVHIVFETLLKYLLDILEEYPLGTTLTSLVNEGSVRLKAEMTTSPANWEEFIGFCTPDQNAASGNEFSEKSICAQILQETKSKGICGPDTALKALIMLAIIQNRVKNSDELLFESLSNIRPEPFRSINTEMSFLANSKRKEFWSVIGDLLLERTLRRHLWVATNKLKYQGDYTYLLESDDGIVRLRGKDGPVFTNPRLGPAINFMEDIGLLDSGGITFAGMKVLSSL
jgi:hypothetical protein